MIKEYNNPKVLPEWVFGFLIPLSQSAEEYVQTRREFLASRGFRLRNPLVIYKRGELGYAELEKIWE